MPNWLSHSFKIVFSMCFAQFYPLENTGKKNHWRKLKTTKLQMLQARFNWPNFKCILIFVVRDTMKTLEYGCPNISTSPIFPSSKVLFCLGSKVTGEYRRWEKLDHFFLRLKVTYKGRLVARSIVVVQEPDATQTCRSVNLVINRMPFWYRNL